MKTGILFVSMTLLVMMQTNPRTTHVRGYTKKNGSFVSPHTRTKENRTQKDNYSTKGNTNPYTGKKGYKTPCK